MPFLAQESLPIPGTDLLSWYFNNNPEIPESKRDEPIYIDAADPIRHYTHRSAERTIRLIAAGLCAQGLKPGDAVCIHSFNTVDYPILVNGIIAAGCIFSGTNPSYTPAELAHAVKAARIKFFIAEPELFGAVLEAAGTVGLGRERVLCFDTREGQVVPEGFESWRRLLEHGEAGWEGFDDVGRSRKETAARLFSSGESK